MQRGIGGQRKRQTEQTPQTEHQQRLERCEGQRGRYYEMKLRKDRNNIHQHSDRNEEEPEEKSPKRADVGLDLMAVFRSGQQKPGQECPKRHRQTGGSAAPSAPSSRWPWARVSSYPEDLISSDR